ncbi:NAD(P)-dependent oxidoreductase, partial [Streptomyces lunaelactis]|uniref:NAD(P)-dependent oxidoreductase n=1 Tax=Streptomyces lunaelactis TaxID=1535768 RepID=UPI0035A0504A
MLGAGPGQDAAPPAPYRGPRTQTRTSGAAPSPQRPRPHPPYEESRTAMAAEHVEHERAEHDDHPAYPVGLRLSGRRVVVIGGGQVAQRRLPALI